jgi:hypothetical protein
MTDVDRIIALTGTCLLLATLVGLLVRGRWRAWYAFTAYQAAVAGFALALLYPPWYHARAYLLQANVVNAVRLAMVLEVGIRTFRAFPGARSTLRRVLLVLLLVTFGLLVLVPTSTNDYRAFLMELQPRMTNATVWIYTAILALILWYRLPVHPLIKSVLLVYVPFLLWDAAFNRAWLERAWEQDVVRYGSQLIYVAMVGYWAWIAWRPESKDEDEGPRGLLDESEDEEPRADVDTDPDRPGTSEPEEPPEKRDGP